MWEMVKEDRASIASKASGLNPGHQLTCHILHPIITLVILEGLLLEFFHCTLSLARSSILAAENALLYTTSVSFQHVFQESLTHAFSLMQQQEFNNHLHAVVS